MGNTDTGLFGIISAIGSLFSFGKGKIQNIIEDAQQETNARMNDQEEYLGSDYKWHRVSDGHVIDKHIIMAIGNELHTVDYDVTAKCIIRDHTEGKRNEEFKRNKEIIQYHEKINQENYEYAISYNKLVYEKYERGIDFRNEPRFSKGQTIVGFDDLWVGVTNLDCLLSPHGEDVYEDDELKKIYVITSKEFVLFNPNTLEVLHSLFGFIKDSSLKWEKLPYDLYLRIRENNIHWLYDEKDSLNKTLIEYDYIKNKLEWFEPPMLTEEEYNNYGKEDGND